MRSFPMFRLASALVAVGLTLGWSATADAADFRGFTWGKGSFNGGLRFASDDLNLGLGLNAGGTLDNGIYIGGLGAYFFGESDSGSVGGVSYDASFSALFLMAEGGYDFGLAQNFVLRPTLALGIVTGFLESCSNALGSERCVDDSSSEFNAALGGQALYLMGNLTLGGELRLLFGELDGIWLGANIGTTF